MRRARASALLLTGAVLLTGLAPVTGAQADPDYPTSGDVRRAKQRAAEALTDVKQIQAALDESTASVEAADLALSQAAEDYDEAKVELDEAKRAYAVAEAAAKQADRRLQSAQRDVGQLASQTYRGGGPIASLDVLFSPTGPDAVLERATLMHSVAAGQQRTLRRMDDARVSATALDRQAEHALQVQDAAARRMQAAQQAAQQRSDAAHEALSEQQALEGVLIGKLASARRTSVAVEQQRQRGLAEEARRRREEAERRRAEAAAEAERNARRNNGGSDNGGSGNGGSGGGSGSGSGDSGGSGGRSGGGSGGDSGGGGTSSGTAGGGASAVSWARDRIGLPYRWAGEGPKSYDCSGLTMKAWAQAGVSLPHSSRLQYRLTKHVSYANLRKGDLIFYATNPSNPSTIHHVTMYAGNGMMVEAPYTGAYVRVVPVRRSGGAMPWAGRP